MSDTPSATAERDGAEGGTPTQESHGICTRPWSPRGRHRRPRPRKVLLAAGGLALAAGALSLVRMVPDTGVSGLGAAEAEPRVDPETGVDLSTNAAATVAATVPTASPSATTVMGGPSALPTPGVSFTPTPTARSSRPTPPTTVPDAPNATGAATPTPAPHPSASTGTTQQPAPTPTPSRTTPPPAPQPDHPDRPGLCVPVIAVCVDPPAARHHY
ncbi:hypothetical protein ACFYO2_11070 [Streptomyces sp. NPDC006602]|uniref:hypothetical protein n=1 Tax=Streptomyces sp. NPDC006602 TaxID=3364751 RepID=UPI0036C94C3B